MFFNVIDLNNLVLNFKIYLVLILKLNLFQNDYFDELENLNIIAF